MEILDVSVPIRPGMVIYPGDPDVRLERASAIAKGDPANVSRLDFGVHSGTHVDAPVHFIEGAGGVETIPVDVFHGPARVLDLTGVHGEIHAADLERLELAERVVFKTTNSELWARDEFVEDYVSLAADGARLLVDRGVRLVGIDYLSIGDEEAHRTLLEARLVPLESLDLRGVEAGDYLLVCAPLLVVGSDGGPARVLLVRE